MAKGTKGGFYAVKTGNQPGVYTTWDDCSEQVKGFNGAVFKKFSTRAEAEAFVGTSSSSTSSTSPSTSASTSTTTPARASTSSILLASTSTAKDSDKNIDIVYSDGSCRGNGAKGSKAGIGVWWGHNDPRNLAERCPGDQTNNRAELIALIRVLETTPFNDRPLVIRTDSQYSIKCVTQWLPNWISRNWISSTGTPVANKPLIQYLSALLALHHARRKSENRVRLEYVKGHAGIEGNEGADGLANVGAMMEEIQERDWDKERERVEKEADKVIRMVVGKERAVERATMNENGQALDKEAKGGAVEKTEATVEAKKAKFLEPLIKSKKTEAPNANSNSTDVRPPQDSTSNEAPQTQSKRPRPSTPSSGLSSSAPQLDGVLERDSRSPAAKRPKSSKEQAREIDEAAIQDFEFLDEDDLMEMERTQNFG